jgi:GPH family glycoside/pentoside/hexuronide:cation symporter
VGAPGLAVLVILAYMIPSSASVPFWIPLSVKYGKIRIWIASMIGTGVSFGGFCLLPFIDDLNIRIYLSFVLAVFAGISAGSGGTIGPSVQSDVIDYDEFVSGERKEGSYFAAWNFVYKGAAGVMLLLTGFVLEFSGFVPNIEQTAEVKFAIVGLYGLFPLVCNLVGAFLLTKFQLDESACIEIREKLEERR